MERSLAPIHPPKTSKHKSTQFYMDLTLDSLINANSRTWNLQAIQMLIDPHDVKTIKILPLSQSQIADRDGWNFTNNGRYTVKSGYQV